MMHTPLTPSSSAPPVLSGSNGAAASSMRSFRASASDANAGSSSTPNTSPASPAIAPSTVFSATLPVKPSVRITSADGRSRSRPSTLPTQPFTSDSNGAAALRNASPLPGFLAVRQQPDRGLVDTEPHPRVGAGEHRPFDEPNRLRVDRRSPVDEELGDQDRLWQRPNTGRGTAIAGRCTPRMRPMPRSAAAIVAPVLPAPTMACAWPSLTARAQRTSDESFLVRTAAAGSSSIAITSDAASTSTPAGATPLGRCDAIASG